MRIADCSTGGTARAAGEEQVHAVHLGQSQIGRAGAHDHRRGVVLEAPQSNRDSPRAVATHGGQQVEELRYRMGLHGPLCGAQLALAVVEIGVEPTRRSGRPALAAAVITLAAASTARSKESAVLCMVWSSTTVTVGECTGGST